MSIGNTYRNGSEAKRGDFVIAIIGGKLCHFIVSSVWQPHSPCDGQPSGRNSLIPVSEMDSMVFESFENVVPADGFTWDAVDHSDKDNLKWKEVAK